MTLHHRPTPPPIGRMTLAEFRTFYDARPAHERWELIAGTPIMMAPPKKNHHYIALNLYTALRQALDLHRPDLVAATAMGTEFDGIVDNYDPEPDVVVVPRADRASDRYAHQVVLFGEVVSESDAATIDDKVALYQRMPTCRHIIVLRQDAVAGRIETRTDAGFTASPLNGPDAVLHLPDLGLICRLLDLYRDTDLLP